jgi:2-isopropylmalate synthase
VILNIHHADSLLGTGIAAAELAQLAGADRVEGCLFGNGERTGNVDLVNLALNLYTQGIHPQVDFSDLDAIIDVVTKCNDIPIHPRHPYAGELVFTAFSGSHQDAIKKGLEVQDTRWKQAESTGEKIWDIPYLAIDPADIGCSYEAVIRVNSQSGKAGIAYLVKQHLGLDMPRRMQIAFYSIIQAVADREAREVTVEDITSAFRRTYHYGGGSYQGRLVLKSFRLMSEPTVDPDTDEGGEEKRRFDGTVFVDGTVRILRGDGNGPLSALLNALKTHLKIDYSIKNYSEHTLGEGQGAKAASYVELVPPGPRSTNESWWGVGVDSDIAGSGLRAVLSAVNSAIGDRILPEFRLSVGFGASSGQSDVASVILDSLQLELPRRLQASFFEVVQRAAGNSDGEMTYTDVVELFKATYKYGGPVGRYSIQTFKVDSVGDGTRKAFSGALAVEGKQIPVSGEGNGPLSAFLSAIRSHVEKGTLSIREYSEHAIGEGTEVKAVSYVELVHELEVERSIKKISTWGIAADTDITGSGLMAVLAAAENLGVKVGA